jgi:hypothetical protein
MTTTTIGELEQAAEEAAGNWRQFDCFSWLRQYDLDDADDWTIVYTHHRDSGLVDQSNAEVIAKAMERYTKGDNPDVVVETHNHWAVGHVDGFSIRVYRRGRITRAFRTWHDIQSRLNDYPLLDEEDYSSREREATLQNIIHAAWRLTREFDLPDGWESEVYAWLSENDCCEIDNMDDLGGSPSEAAIRRAMVALGYIKPA